MLAAARRLFNSKGFHATTTAELASAASVSMGQFYRLFASKDELVLTIVQQNVHSIVKDMDLIFDAVERGEETLFGAISAIAKAAMERADSGLLFEILAEATRNHSVADRLEELMIFYRDGVRRLAVLARPDLPPDELTAYTNIMASAFIGLAHHTAVAPSDDVDLASESAACVMTRALGLPVPGAGS